MKAQTTKAFFKRHGIEIEFLKMPKTGEEALDNVIEGILETFDQLHSIFHAPVQLEDKNKTSGPDIAPVAVLPTATG